jgi:hypothetical protein
MPDWSRSSFAPVPPLHARDKKGAIEVAFLRDGQVAFRYEEGHDAPFLCIPKQAWLEFLDGVRANEFEPPDYDPRHASGREKD